MKLDADKLPDELTRRLCGYVQESIDSRERKDWEKTYKRAWEFYENRQWTEDEKDVLRENQFPDLVLNKITPNVNAKCALVTDSKPKITCIPVGNGDQAVAEVIGRAIDLVWDDEYANKTMFEVCKESVIGALGWIEAKWDASAGVWGKVSIEECSPEDVHVDPTVRKSAFLSGRFVVKAREITRRDALARYDVQDSDLVNPFTLDAGDRGDGEGHPGQAGDGEDYQDDGGGGGVGAAIDELKRQERMVWEIEAYLLETVKKEFILDLTTGKEIERPEGAKKTEAKQLVERINAISMQTTGQEAARLISRRKKQVRHVLLVGSKVISDRVNPFGTDCQGDPLLGMVAIPNIIVRGPYPKGDVEYVIDPQREHNKRRGQIINMASQAANSNVFYAQNSIAPAEVDRIGKPGKAIAFDTTKGTPPFRITPGTLGMDLLIGLDQRAAQEIDETLGLPDAVRGVGAKGDAARKTMALQEFGTLNTKPFIRNLETAIEQLGRVVAFLLVNYAPREFWERLVDQQREQNLIPGLQKILAKDISALHYDIRVGAGSSLPVNRVAKFEALQGLMQAAPNEGKLIIFEHMVRNFDEPGLEEEMEKAKQQAMQMQAMQLQAQGGGMPGGMGGPRPPQGQMQPMPGGVPGQQGGM